MILLADVGNSRIKWAIYEKGEFLQEGLIYHHQTKLSEAGGLKQWEYLPRPNRALIVSVAGPELCSTLKTWVRRVWAIDAEFVIATATCCGLYNAYAEPALLGADRWVAMIAARALTQQACYVVDCGTALTIDAVAADGRHLGGVIVPGIQLMRQALYSETRQIIPEQGEYCLFGTSTKDCVWGGTIYAVAAAIDGITERMMAARGPGIRFLTGGGAELIAEYLLGKFQIQPDLVFHGLKLIAEQQESKDLYPSNCFLACHNQ